jgi:hypothetical protein
MELLRQHRVAASVHLVVNRQHEANHRGAAVDLRGTCKASVSGCSAFRWCKRRKHVVLRRQVLAAGLLRGRTVSGA